MSPLDPNWERHDERVRREQERQRRKKQVLPADPRPAPAPPAYLGNPHDSPLWQELADELHGAMAWFAPLNSPHEGFGVIYEEFMLELAPHLHANTGRSPEARHEALQVAAMALRYIVDLCDD